MEIPKTKIVSAQAFIEDGHGCLCVTCEDGSVWLRVRTKWTCKIGAYDPRNGGYWREKS